MRYIYLTALVTYQMKNPKTNQNYDILLGINSQIVIYSTIDRSLVVAVQVLNPAYSMLGAGT